MREQDAPQTHFGFRQVPLSDKQRLVDDVFHKVARRYDLMNDLMSGGLHRAWKDVLVTALNPPTGDQPFRLLDMAGGTGDIAARVIAEAGTGTSVTVLDVNDAMLAVGRERAEQAGYPGQVSFVNGNVQSLPFAAGSYDACAIAFGIRNVPEIEAALAETLRVLRRPGLFACLEFSTVDLPMLDAVYDFYSFNVIPLLGRLVTGHAEPYRYLVESIRRFPKPEAFAALIREAGFRRVSYRVMSGGIVALHCAWRL